MNEEYDEVAKEVEANAMAREEFAELYGFDHDCHCAADWMEGRTGLVSECYTELCDDALTTCHRFKGELADAERKLGVLRVQIGELGGEARV
jgi:hypothetical protein